MTMMIQSYYNNICIDTIMITVIICSIASITMAVSVSISISFSSEPEGMVD